MGLNNRKTQLQAGGWTQPRWEHLLCFSQNRLWSAPWWQSAGLDPSFCDLGYSLHWLNEVGWSRNSCFQFFSYHSRRNLQTSGKREHFPHLNYTQSCIILYVSTENAREMHQRGLCFSYNIKFAQEMLFVSFKNSALSKGDTGVPHPQDPSNTCLHFSKPRLS